MLLLVGKYLVGLLLLTNFSNRATIKIVQKAAMIQSEVTKMHYVKKFELRMIKESSFPYENIQITCPADSVDFFQKTLRMNELPMEQVWALYLDTKHKIIGCEMVSKGGLSGASLFPRDLLRSAILMNASAIIMAHNHPSGDPKPSPDDISTTKNLMKGCDLVGIDLLDHIVIGDVGYTSIKEYCGF